MKSTTTCKGSDLTEYTIFLTALYLLDGKRKSVRKTCKQTCPKEKYAENVSVMSTEEFINGCHDNCTNVSAFNI